MPDLASVDWMILLIYFFFVFSIGLSLRQYVQSSADFLLAGRSLPGWVCGIAYLGASLGSLEVIGMGAAGARYGLVSAAFFGLGSVVPILFLALYMMPLYYGAQQPASPRRPARSAPDYLGLRFDAKTRMLASCLGCAALIVGAGISLYAMARIAAALHLFDAMFHAQAVGPEGVLAIAIGAPAAFVLLYVALGGLAAAIYSQVLEFFVLLAAFLPPVFLGIKQAGGWSAVKTAVKAGVAGGLGAGGAPGLANGHAGGIGVLAAAAGLGILLTAGYWCTDFRLVQTALAAEDRRAARRGPVIAAAVRIALPLLLILAGAIALELPTPHTTTFVRIENGSIYHDINVVPQAAEQGRGLVPARTESRADSMAGPMAGKVLRDSKGRVLLDYSMAIPNLVPHFLPGGLLGLGLAALLAALTGGVAAQVAAFNAVFTYDLYQPLLRKDAEDKHLLAVGRWATVAAVLLAAGVAWGTTRLGGAPGILGVLAMGFALASAPMLPTFLLGMFWRRTTGTGAFAGLVAGFAAAIAHYGLTATAGAVHGIGGIGGGWIAVAHRYPGALAQAGWTAAFAMAANLAVTAAVSLCTEARPDAELAGLVHSLRIEGTALERTKKGKGKPAGRSIEKAAGVILLASILAALFFF